MGLRSAAGEGESSLRSIDRVGGWGWGADADADANLRQVNDYHDRVLRLGICSETGQNCHVRWMGI